MLVPWCVYGGQRTTLQEWVLSSCYAHSSGLPLDFRLEASALTCWATSLPLTSTLKGQLSLCLCAIGIYNDNGIIIFILGMKSLDSCISRLFGFIGNHREEVRANKPSELKKARRNCWKNKKAIWWYPRREVIKGLKQETRKFLYISLVLSLFLSFLSLHDKLKLPFPLPGLHLRDHS